jgi:hypothetical protein
MVVVVVVVIVILAVQLAATTKMTQPAMLPNTRQFIELPHAHFRSWRCEFANSIEKSGAFLFLPVIRWAGEIHFANFGQIRPVERFKIIAIRIY